MKKWENAIGDEPQGGNAGIHLNIFGAASARTQRKQQLAAREILGMESYLKDLMDLRKKYPDCDWSEAVMRATARVIAKLRERYILKYHTLPLEIEVQ